MLTFALVCNSLQRNMATAGKIVESQPDQAMEAEERVGFLGMFKRA